MLPHGFFRQLGLYIQEGFLDEQLCAQIRSEMAQASHSPGTVSTVREGRVIEDVVKETTRKVKRRNVSNATQKAISSRIEQLQPTLAKHFGSPLSEFQPPSFLEYDKGHFFVRHTDTGTPQYSGSFVYERKVSMSVFLNAESDEPLEDTYSGGSLFFYGLWDDPALKEAGFPLRGEVGLLVAFPSNMSHEVKPVLRGIRRTIVTWFY